MISEWPKIQNTFIESKWNTKYIQESLQVNQSINEYSFNKQEKHKHISTLGIDTVITLYIIIWFDQTNINRKLLISRVPTKAKSQEPVYSQALKNNKIEWSRSRESGRQIVRRLWWMVLGVETGREVWGRQWIRIGFAKEQCFININPYNVKI